jgi:hypothetical protein
MKRSRTDEKQSGKIHKRRVYVAAPTSVSHHYFSTPTRQFLTFMILRERVLAMQEEATKNKNKSPKVPTPVVIGGFNPPENYNFTALPKNTTLQEEQLSAAEIRTNQKLIQDYLREQGLAEQEARIQELKSPITANFTGIFASTPKTTSQSAPATPRGRSRSKVYFETPSYLNQSRSSSSSAFGTEGSSMELATPFQQEFKTPGTPRSFYSLPFILPEETPLKTIPSRIIDEASPEQLDFLISQSRESLSSPPIQAESKRLFSTPMQQEWLSSVFAPETPQVTPFVQRIPSTLGVSPQFTPQTPKIPTLDFSTFETPETPEEKTAAIILRRSKRIQAQTK